MKDIEIHNYSKMKKDLKRFSFDVDVNMYFNGWERVTTMDVSRADKSVDLVRGIHIASKYPSGSEYVFRRFSATGGDSGGLPIITIYRKK